MYKRQTCRRSGWISFRVLRILRTVRKWAVRIFPVSYTHLDVYKRQELSSREVAAVALRLMPTERIRVDNNLFMVSILIK